MLIIWAYKLGDIKNFQYNILHVFSFFLVKKYKKLNSFLKIVLGDKNHETSNNNMEIIDTMGIGNINTFQYLKKKY